MVVALEEYEKYGSNYAKQVVKNAKTIAEELYNNGINVAYTDLGFTKSHQIYLPVNYPEEGRKICSTLEKAEIIVNIMVRTWNTKSYNDWDERKRDEENSKLHH
ncbi:MAG: hypothetical protein ACTSYM_03330 [Candidatus Baldrarchaeia archaeon]